MRTLNLSLASLVLALVAVTACTTTKTIAPKKLPLLLATEEEAMRAIIAEKGLEKLAGRGTKKTVSTEPDSGWGPEDTWEIETPRNFDISSTNAVIVSFKYENRDAMFRADYIMESGMDGKPRFRTTTPRSANKVLIVVRGTMINLDFCKGVRIFSDHFGPEGAPLEELRPGRFEMFPMEDVGHGVAACIFAADSLWSKPLNKRPTQSL